MLTSTTDEADTQLGILAHIARSFSDPDAVQALLESRSLDATWNDLRRSLTHVA